MNLEYFIAKRIHFRQDRKHVSRPAVRIAILGIAIGLTVMLLAVSIVTGFKKEIRNKTIGFGGHIQITNFDSNNTYELTPIVLNDTLKNELAAIPGVKHIQAFATKPGIIKTNEQFQGIVLKGIDEHFDWNFFKSNLLEGDILHIGDSLQNQAVISKHQADLFKLKLGDTFFAYFMQDQVRARRFTISGIYSTNFIEYDKLFILTDMRHIRQLNNWDDSEVSGYEILIHDFDKIDEIGDQVYFKTANKAQANGNMLYTQTIRDINPQIFSWLDLLDINVWVILFLMLAVAGFNMISGLLILILERTTMIGILKSIGATNWSVRKIFLYHSLFLIGKGMLWGNIIGLSICSIQYFTGIIPLDPEAYYIATVPILFNWPLIIGLNIGTLLASILMMIGPSYLITKILPAKIIRYE
ncbi:MAG: ABC transporter permease [Paludibacter sp.]|nr:ABC transporter permease [Paludibacter sp.]MDD4198581.1 ABC transporter permease [Paludibacter sp.]MDD4427709.1 ABC transporter permease [Paludibacter sp.]